MYLKNYFKNKKVKKGFALYLSVAFFFILFSFQNVYASTSWSALTFNDNLDVSTNLSTTADRYWYLIRPTYGFSFNENVTFNSITLKIKNSSTQMNTPHIETFRQFGAGTCSKNEIDGATEITANYDGFVTFTFASSCTIPSGSPFYIQMNGEAGTSYQLYGTNSNTFGADTRAGYGSSGTSNDATLYHPYVQFNGGTFVPPDTTPRIETFTYATSTRIANVTGYWQATTTPNITQRLTFWQQSDVLGQESWQQIIATTTGAFNYSFEFLGLPTPASTSTPIISPYDLNVSLDQYDGNYYDPFGNYGLDTSRYITNIDSETRHITTLSYNLPDLSSISDFYSIPEYDCGLTQLGGCMKNAGIWLMYPSPESVNKFKTLNTDLASKFPFAYAYQAPTLVSKLFNSTQTASSTVGVTVPNFGTINFLSNSLLSAVPFASTIKTILGWLLWILLLEFIYYRVIRSHDPHTPQ